MSHFSINGTKRCFNHAAGRRIIFGGFFVLLIVAVCFLPKILLNKANAIDTMNMAEVRFLNTQTYNISGGGSFSSNESVLIKTVDNKYVLIDTGNGNSGIRDTIKSALRAYQGTEDVVLDYLVVSHMDGDHYGNAYQLIADSGIKVNNIIIKHENWMNYIDYDNNKQQNYDVAWGTKTSKKWYYIAILTYALRDGAEVYTNDSVLSDNEVDAYFNQSNNSPYLAGYNASTFKTTLQERIHNLNEGMSINIGNYMVFSLFNTQMVFTDNTYCNGIKYAVPAWYAYHYNDSKGYGTDGSASGYGPSITSLGLPSNTFGGGYVWFDGDQYPNTTLTSSGSSAVWETNGTTFGKYRYWYADMTTREACSSNAESLAVLAEVKNDNASKYMYFANDIENFGYDAFPDSDGIYGNGYDVFYTEKPDFSNGEFVGTKVDIPKSPQETQAAISISNKLGSALNDIVIYQESHHGFNNAPDALNILNINRSSNPPYAIATVGEDPSLSRYFHEARGYYYSLKNIPVDHKMYTGENNDGVTCYINNSGGYGCSYGVNLVTKVLAYDMNSGTGTIDSQICTTSALDARASSMSIVQLSILFSSAKA